MPAEIKSLCGVIKLKHRPSKYSDNQTEDFKSHRVKNLQKRASKDPKELSYGLIWLLAVAF